MAAKGNFEVGDEVRVKVKKTNAPLAFWEWSGKILEKSEVEKNVWEYLVENAPSLYEGSAKLLAWEHELEVIV